MGRNTGYILLMAVSLTAGAARADFLAGRTVAGAGMPTFAAQRLSDLAVATDCVRFDYELSHDAPDPLIDMVNAPLAAARASSLAHDDIRAMPSGPDSASLFLAAALGAGAWHLVRSTRQAGAAIVGDWYHDQAPDRIGHAVRVDVVAAPCMVCAFDRPFDGDHAEFKDLSERCSLRFRDRRCATEIDHRGPPGGSFTRVMIPAA